MQESATPGVDPSDWEDMGMASAVQEMIDILDLEPLEVNLFRGRSPQSSWQRVFGGQVIGQALVAACRTVETWRRGRRIRCTLISCSAAIPKCRSSTRSIASATARASPRAASIAIQHGHAIFSMSVSFHVAERGLSHQFKMPDVPKPDALPSEAEMQEAHLPLMPEPVRRYYERERPIELRPVEYGRYLGEKSEDGRFNVWIRATGRLPDEPAIHQCVLAYASDMMLLDAALIPHGSARCSAKTSWRRASTTRCGSTGRSAPTSGCSMPRTARTSPARAAFRAA